jgi:alpha-beta hydrolase superfamily lysophospholipase
MHILRTRIKKDIVCEFLPPVKRLVTRHRSRIHNKVIILCGGMPSYPGKSAVPEFLSKKGYWTFVPRYRGTWESSGSFLKRSPHRDVLDVIDQLPRGFKDLWSGKTYKIKRAEIYLIGSSFGGAAAILASRDPRVRKAVALSPVTDWRVSSKTESVEKLMASTQTMFGDTYRGTKKNWNKLRGGVFYNPAHEIASIDGRKLLVIHAKDDKVVYAKTSIAFTRAAGAKLILLAHGGHFGTSSTMHPEFWKKIKGFLK